MLYVCIFSFLCLTASCLHICVRVWVMEFFISNDTCSIRNRKIEACLKCNFYTKLNMVTHDFSGNYMKMQRKKL